MVKAYRQPAGLHGASGWIVSSWLDNPYADARFDNYYEFGSTIGENSQLTIEAAKPSSITIPSGEVETPGQPQSNDAP